MAVLRFGCVTAWPCYGLAVLDGELFVFRAVIVLDDDLRRHGLFEIGRLVFAGGAFGHASVTPQALAASHASVISYAMAALYAPVVPHTSVASYVLVAPPASVASQALATTSRTSVASPAFAIRSL